MSRSGAALAYSYQVDEQLDSARSSEGEARLLGLGEWGKTQPRRSAERGAWLVISDDLARFGGDALYDLEPYSPPDASGSLFNRLGVRHPGWLLATAACVVALFALVSPVFAGEKGTLRPRGLIISGYNAPVEGSAQPAPPEIDTTTAPAPASSSAPAPAPPPQPLASTPYSVLGPPSISVGTIEEVLRRYGSPAAGKGPALHSLGVKYGIDPAFALAFFVHESGCGTKGVARFTQSLGNIRFTGTFENYQGYRKYPTWEAGMEDWYMLITDLYINGWGLKTVDDIVPVYAPSGDNNDPPAYIVAVKSMVDTWRGK